MVVLLEVPNDWLNGLAALEQLALFGRDTLGFAPVHDVHLRVVGVYAAVAQIHKGGAGLAPGVLHQNAGLLELGVEGVAVIGVVAKRLGPGDA